MFRNILARSRYVIAIAVIGTFLAAITMLIYGGLAVLNLMYQVFSQGIFTVKGAKVLEIEGTEVIDLFLFGAVLYIISLGLYVLFIDDRLPLPHWLEISSLNHLKEQLIVVVIVLLAVTFLGYVVDWDGSASILAPGIAVGLVLFALGFLLGSGFRTFRATRSYDADETKAA